MSKTSRRARKPESRSLFNAWARRLQRQLDVLADRHAQHHWIDYRHWFNLSPGGRLVDELAGRNPSHNVPRAPSPKTCGLSAGDQRLLTARKRFGTDCTLAVRPVARLRLYASDPGVLMHWCIALILGIAVLREPPLLTPLLFIGGWTVYLVEEHLVHRWVFHAEPPRQQALFNLFYRLHVGHHDQVAHRGLVFTPAWFSGPLVLGNALLMWAALRLVHERPVAATATVLLGGLCAYLAFEYFHLQTHTRPVRIGPRRNRRLTPGGKTHA